MILIMISILFLFIISVISIIWICSKLTDTEHFTENHHEKKIVHGKTIWLLWLQGWNDGTPWLVQQVRKSWEQLNPTWNVELVTEANLHKYVNIEYINNPVLHPAAKSDIIRLHLLAEHGGVWADATMLCMMSLDLWLYDALEPAGFWMYHGRDYGAGPASWFMISIKDSLIAKKWKDATDNFWKNGNIVEYDYFWMDGLFKELCEKDTVFLNEWKKVPYLWCEARGQAHMLAEKCMQNNPELKDILLHNPPYAVKLSRHNFDANDKNSNAYAAITYALEQKYAPYPLHPMKYMYNDKMDWQSDTVAVSADCGEKENIGKLFEICKANGIKLIIYDKCNFCKNIPNEIYSRPLKNVGREGNTFLHFVIRYYDNLPKHIIFIPSNFRKHPDRLIKFQELIDHKDQTGCFDSLEGSEDFVLHEYEGRQIQLADVRPFKNWYEKYIGQWDPNGKGPCWSGIMATNRERVLRHPKHFYENIIKQCDYVDESEVGHFIERSMQAIF